MSDDLVKRLREHVTDIFNFRGNVMTAWDMVRSMIAKGDKSSGPRDIIESYLAAYAEDMKEAADRIEKLEALVERLRDDNSFLIDDNDKTFLHQESRIEKLEAALRKIAESDIPRTVKAQFRDDGEPSKHDRCEHGLWMYEECGCCVEDYAREILEPQPTMQAPVERKDLSALKPEPLRALSSEEIKGMKNE